MCRFACSRCGMTSQNRTGQRQRADRGRTARALGLMHMLPERRAIKGKHSIAHRSSSGGPLNSSVSVVMASWVELIFQRYSPKQATDESTESAIRQTPRREGGRDAL